MWRCQDKSKMELNQKRVKSKESYLGDPGSADKDKMKRNLTAPIKIGRMQS